MTEAPERIWIHDCVPADDICWRDNIYFTTSDGPSNSLGLPEPSVEYIRADVFDALVAAAREEALREAAQVVHDDWGWDEPGSSEKSILALIEKQ